MRARERVYAAGSAVGVRGDGGGCDRGWWWWVYGAMVVGGGV